VTPSGDDIQLKGKDRHLDSSRGSALPSAPTQKRESLGGLVGISVDHLASVNL
jgi:hypothetical protein